MKEIIVILGVLFMIWVSYEFYKVDFITEKYHELVEKQIRKNHENDPDWEDDLF